MTRPVVCVHGVTHEEDVSGFSFDLWDEVSRLARDLGVTPPRWAEAVYSNLIDIPGSALTAPIEFFRDVSEYEKNNALHLQVIERVRAIVQKFPGCILVAHSLGSVVAHDTLALTPRLDVSALVTLGSPLGIDCDLVSFAWRVDSTRQWWPHEGRRWLDLWDAGDPIHTGCLGGLEVVPGARGLRSVGYPCESRQVDVGCDLYTAHVGYWQSTQAAAAILDLATQEAA